MTLDGTSPVRVHLIGVLKTILVEQLVSLAR
jgi:hypothetical protein